MSIGAIRGGAGVDLSDTYVPLAGAATISGQKDFTTAPTVNGSPIGGLSAPPLGLLIAQRAEFIPNSVSDPSLALSETSKVVYYVAYDAEDIVLWFANVKQGGVVHDNEITFGASIFVGNYKPVTFGGRDLVTLSPGAVVRSDPISVSAWATNNTQNLEVRTYVTVAAGLPSPAAPLVTTARTGGSIPAGAAYGYRITATNTAGESLPSLEAGLTIPAQIATPTINSVTPSTTGGTLTAGTQSYRITAVGPAPSYPGETLPSVAVTAVTTGSTGSCVIAWTATAGLIYRVYGRVGGSEVQIGQTGAGASSFTDTGATGSNAALPVANTTQTNTNVNTLMWPKVAGATGYKVYGRTFGAELLIATLGNVLTYADTGSVTPSGALPLTNSAGGLTIPYNHTCNVAKLDGTNRLTTRTDDRTNAAAIAATSQSCFAPFAVTGIVKEVRKVSVLLSGDSIMLGTGATAPPDVNGYGVLAAVAAGWPYALIAAGGEQGGPFGGADGHVYRGLLGSMTTHAVVGYGVNDVGTGANTLAQLQAGMLRMWKLYWLKGNKVYGTTITPVSSSSDSWATVGNQTTAANNAVRVNFNNWLRAGAPIDPTTKAAVTIGTGGALVSGVSGHFLTGWFETADAVESTRDSGKWKVGYVLVSDGIGTHPSPTGHAALAAACVMTGFTV